MRGENTERKAIRRVRGKRQNTGQPTPERGKLRPGVFEVASKEDFEKLSEDVSPEYPFLKDNREIMSADPGGLFRCLMVRAEGEKENMLIAQRHNTLYVGYGRDYRSVDLQGVPVERIALEEPKAYQEHAVFLSPAQPYQRPQWAESTAACAGAANQFSGGTGGRSMR